MADTLRNVRFKVARADEHLVDLQARIDKWSETNVADVVHEHDRKTGWHILRVTEVTEVPAQWSAIVADYAVNLRTALDYLARELVAANKRTPERNNKFPIFPVPPDKGRFRDTVRGMHPEVRAKIKDLQPYSRPDRPEPEPLEVIAGFANSEKHVEPSGCLALIAPFEYRDIAFTPRQNVTAVGNPRFPLNVGSPISGAELFACRFAPPEAEVDMEMQGDLSAQIAFGDPPVPMGRIKDLIVKVRAVIDFLGPYVTNPPPPA